MTFGIQSIVLLKALFIPIPTRLPQQLIREEFSHIFKKIAAKGIQTALPQLKVRHCIAELSLLS